MPASSAPPVWDQVRPVPPPRAPSPARARLVRLAAAVTAALLLWWLGLRTAAVAVAVVFTTLTAAATAWPAVDRAATSVSARISRGASAALGAVLMGLVHFAVFLPASLLMRLAGRDPLRLRFQPDLPSYWTIRRPVPARLAARQYSLEPREPVFRRSVATRAAAAAGVVVLALAANYAAGAAWDALRPSRDDPRAGSPALADSPWSDEWFAEFADLRQRWEPLLGLVTDDHRGAHINVSGLTRASYQPAGPPADAPEVWFFGGSTTWGTVQRDEHTIPSHVARLAEADGTPVTVRNFGQRGWAIWQEATLLAQLVAAGEAPDVAVFYDGINEVAAQFQDPGARPTFGQAPRVAEAVRDAAGGPGPDDAWEAYVEHSAVHKLARAVSRSTREPVPADAELERRAADAADLHRQAVDHVRRLGAAYGFDAMFFWQPAVFTKPQGEEAARAGLGAPVRAIGRMYEAATPAAARPPVIDVSGVFEGVAGPLFVDWAHTNEEGAALVAAAIYAELRPVLEEAASP